MIDSNIFISALLNPQSIPKKAYEKAVDYPYRLILCDYIKEEVLSVFIRKFPHKLFYAENFFAEIIAEFVIASKKAEADEKLIRDIKDRPILRAAIQGNVDILVTGDKDFLESEVTYPKIMTAQEFLGYEN
jgi:putative PIN family toxin of toxin-antitoxin system